VDWTPKELQAMHLLQELGYPIRTFTVQLYCINCPWACIKDIRSSKLVYYSAEEVYKCPLCEQQTIKCLIEGAT